MAAFNNNNNRNIDTVNILGEEYPINTTLLKIQGKDSGGTIPEEVFQLKNLKYLLLIDVNLKRIPIDIKNLQELEMLNFSGNPHLQRLPNEIMELTQLRALRLSGNFILTNLSEKMLKYLKKNLVILIHSGEYTGDNLKNKLDDMITNKRSQNSKRNMLPPTRFQTTNMLSKKEKRRRNADEREKNKQFNQSFEYWQLMVRLGSERSLKNKELMIEHKKRKHNQTTKGNNDAMEKANSKKRSRTRNNKNNNTRKNSKKSRH